MIPFYEPKSSRFDCVEWSVKTKQWKASIFVKGCGISCGEYETELEAAHAVNDMCDKHDIPRKNPKIGDPPRIFKVHHIQCLNLINDKFSSKRLKKELFIFPDP